MRSGQELLDICLSADTNRGDPLQGYLKNPHEIERRSFAAIRSLTDLSGFSDDEMQVVMRLVHSSGEPEIAPCVRFSANAITRGIAAIADGHPILCDVQMVRHGLSQRNPGAAPLCFLNHGDVAGLAEVRGHSRTMTALEHWLPHLHNSIAIIGNAPTALFRLLEIIDQGADKPALVIGMPVGFIGAQEAKQALWTSHQRRGVECITLLGRRGGSALAAAAVNTLARLHLGERF